MSIKKWKNSPLAVYIVLFVEIILLGYSVYSGMQPLVVLIVSAVVGVMFLIYCFIYAYMAFFKLDFMVQYHLKNWNELWMRGIPDRFVSRENYRTFVRVMGFVFLLLAVVIILVNVYLFNKIKPLL